jgi:hypothetical protein
MGPRERRVRLVALLAAMFTAGWITAFISRLPFAAAGGGRQFASVLVFLALALLVCGGLIRRALGRIGTGRAGFDSPHGASRGGRWLFAALRVPREPWSTCIFANVLWGTLFLSSAWVQIGLVASVASIGVALWGARLERDLEE